MADVDLAYACKLPPEKAIEYFRAKGYLFSWDWHDVWQEAHAKAFTVAKAMQADILEDIRGMVDKAISQGTTLDQFRKELEPSLRAKGWWGRKFIADEEGNVQKIQLGSPRRLQTIYNTNLQTAYQAGRWKGQMANVKSRPYWMYVAVMDSRTRPAHAALNGLVFRYNDPFWKSFYPPCGFSCRCHARALDKAGLDERVKTGTARLETSEGKLGRLERPISQHTGELREVATYQVGNRRVETDPGWSYNPGQAAWQPELDKYDYSVAKQYIRGAVTGPDFTRFLNGESKGNYPLAVLDGGLRDQIGAKSQVVQISDQTLEKNRANHPEIGLDDYRSVQEMIDEPKAIVKEGENVLIFIKANEAYYHAVVKSTRNGQEIYLTSLRKTNLKNIQNVLKRGEVLRNDLF